VGAPLLKALIGNDERFFLLFVGRQGQVRPRHHDLRAEPVAEGWSWDCLKVLVA
jgi:hypothetical protein